ncbi:glycosyltransferase family 4 protein [Thiopseudomonas alkaliphila]|uniref:Glycosyltransferase family 4 protein n=1 Tax=Thiopseudomonas alkaliphila TaxID=1697053 RepID=A0AAW7DQN7_9GAMM|nr:glycosyltransferase family 4 protein [Thiopseudomonas alkaliphila]MDM1695096.1 glycosyltransferase family 4 protein [Thiopseudomonas alkaliphila]
MKFLLIAGFADSLIAFRKPLIQALLNQGLSVHVAAPELLENTQVMAELKQLGVTAHNIPMQRAGMNPLADLKALLALWQLMRKVKPDYVLGYTVKPVIYGSLAAWLAGVPKRFALITGLGFAFIDQEGQRSKVRAIVQRLYRMALSRCHNVFFQNPDDQALFKQLNILAPNAKSTVVNGSGVDVAQFNVVPLPNTSAPRFLLIGRLLGDKGVREYVQAAKLIKQQYPEAQFDLVGWIDANPNTITQPELDQWIQAGTINFLGRLSDVRPAIENCSVYVLPSYREGTPRTVLEAMAMGRAVITTDAPGCRETVTEGDNGFLVPIKDAHALAEAMLKFIETPELISQMGQRSRLLAEQKYDVHIVNQQMLKGMGF